LCPSPSTFVIGLGPTNPWMIIMATETLFFRRTGISPVLRLLVPTFSLPHAPPWLTPLASKQSGMLSYHATLTNECGILKFGNILSPDYLRRGISSPGKEPMLTHAKPQRPYHRWQEKYDKASALVSFASLSTFSGTL